jgi:hypothetical protein
VAAIIHKRKFGSADIESLTEAERESVAEAEAVVVRERG